MPLGTDVGLSPGNIVLDGNPAPPPTERGTAGPALFGPHFSAYIYCGQTARWIKMPLFTQVGLGPGDIVLDGTQLPQGNGHSSLKLFSPCLLWPNDRPRQQLHA